jgi:putative membrane protein
MRTMSRRIEVAAVMVAAVALGACKARDEGAAGTADTTAARRTDTAGAAASGGWTDGAIVAFTTTADGAEIREGQLAQSKATDPAVKAFAQQMVSDHGNMVVEGKALAARLNITPDATRKDLRDLAKDTDDEINDLTNKPAGADWDKNYIDKEIDGHKKVLDKLQDAAKNTNNAQLRTALEKATSKVQEHLTKAQDIKAKLSK